MRRARALTQRLDTVHALAWSRQPQVQPLASDAASAASSATRDFVSASTPALGAAAAPARVPRIKFPPRLGPGGARLSLSPRPHDLHGHGHAAAAAAAVPAAVGQDPPRAAAPPAHGERQGGAAVGEGSQGTASAATGPLAAGGPPRPVEPYTEVVASNIRKVIASRLVASKQGAPHLYLTRDAHLDAVNALRSRLAGEGRKHSVNDFVIRAAAVALAKVPAGGALAPGAAVDISIAVATPTGLMTPIIKGADKLTLGQVSATVKELAQLARENKLKPDQFQGGCFSVSNLGMFPVDQFAAILNPPQAAILAVGRAEQQVSLGPDGQPRGSSVAAVTLSVDATRVDAVAAAEWLEAFAQALGVPEKLV